MRKAAALVLMVTMLTSLAPTGVMADEGQQYKEGTYEATATGFGGRDNPVKVSVTVKDNQITDLTSPEHSGESFWNIMNVDDLLSRIVNIPNNIEAVNNDQIDGVSGATYSSNAVFKAVKTALADARQTSVDPGQDQPKSTGTAAAQVVDNTYLAYANPAVSDNTFIDPQVSYSIGQDDSISLDITVRPAKGVQLKQFYDTKTDIVGQDVDAIDFSNFSYETKEAKMTADDSSAGTKTFRITLPAEDKDKLEQMAISMNVYFSKDKQTELGGGILNYGGQYPVYLKIKLDAPVPQKEESGYVLMNIPYEDFYKAELGEKDPAVDAVTSATKQKTRSSLAAGSYHQNSDGSDISGIVYPVYVEDLSKLEDLTEITDDSTVTITTTLRGQTSTVDYKGQDALFESPSYSYYKLSEKPASYKTLTIGQDGSKTFSAASKEARTVTGASATVKDAPHHAEVELSLTGTEGIEAGDKINGAVVSFSDGSKIGLRHVVELWRAVEIGGSADQFAGKTITNVRYYTQDDVIDYPMNVKIGKKADITAAFNDAKTVALTGLPEDMENPVATVQTKVGRGEKATVVAKDVPVKDGKITLDAEAVEGTTYTVSVKSDNYLTASAEAAYTVKKPSHHSSGGGGGSSTPAYTISLPQDTGVTADKTSARKGATVTLTVKPQEGKTVDKVTVKDKNGKEIALTASQDGTYTFTMPASGVNVAVTYKDANGHVCPSEPYMDVDQSLWYHEPVDYVISRGLMTGTADKVFAPDQTTTRAMVVAMLYRMEGSPAAETSASFADVAAGSWYEKAVNWGASQGIIRGYSQDAFGPDDVITREQMAAIMQRYAQYKGVDVSGRADLTAYADKDDISPYAEEVVAWAVDTGLIKGMTENTLQPGGLTTRAQMAAVMMRLCQNVLK
jgi:uncharacterized protein with FMN-binding domain